MRRRRLIFRSAVLAIALAAAIALTVATFAPGFAVGLAFLAMLAYVIVVVELPRVVSAARDRSPDYAPPGRWWWVCELPRDHQLVRLATDDPTWRCSRCGHVQHRPNPRSIGESLGAVEQSWVPRHDDM